MQTCRSILVLAALALACPWAGGQELKSGTTITVILNGEAQPGVPVILLRAKDSNDFRGKLEPVLALDSSGFKSRAGSTTDANGRVATGDFQGFVLALAWSGESFGACTVSSDDGRDHELQLEPDESVTVRLLDVQGVPQANLSICCALGRRRSSSFRHWLTTDQLGQATFKHVHLGFESRYEELVVLSKEARVSRIFSTAAHVRGAGPARNLYYSEPCPTRIDIVLEGCGLLELVAVDDQGKILTDARPVELGCIKVDHGNRRTLDFTNGIIRVPVTADVDYQVAWNLYNDFSPEKMATIPSLAAGESRRFEVNWGAAETYPRYLVRLRSPEGELVSSGRAEFSVGYKQRDRDNEMRISEAEPAADGSFDVSDLDWMNKVLEVEGGEFTDLLVRISDRQGRLLEGRLALPTPLPAQDAMLGEIRLEQGNLAVAGRVVDERGRAVEHARVLVLGDEDVTEDAYSCAETQTAADGTFRIPDGMEIPDSFVVGVMADGYRPKPVPGLSRGVTGLIIVLVEDAVLVLGVEGLDGFDRDDFPLFLAAEAGSMLNSRWRFPEQVGGKSLLRGRLRGLNEVVWDRLDPGRYRIETRFNDAETPDLTIAVLEVSRPGDTRFELPEGLSLKSDRAYVALSFDCEGRHSENADVVIFATTDDQNGVLARLKSGRIPTSPEMPSLRGFVRDSSVGLRAFFVSAGGKTNETVTLASVSRLKVAKSESIPPESWQELRIQVLLVESALHGFAKLQGFDPFENRVFSPAAADVPIALPGAGRYRVNFGIDVGGGAFESLASTVFEVEEGPGQEIEIPMPTSEALLERLARSRKD